MKRSLVLASILLVSSAAMAQTSPDAAVEARYQQGMDLRELQQDAQALAIFQEIYSQTRQPRALAQVAMAEGALSRWLDAERHLLEALATSDPWVSTRRATLDGALATIRTHLGQLEVQANVPSAEVWIDGRRAGAANAPIRVVAGTTQFEVRVAGHVASTRVATVPPGGLARESIALVPSSTSDEAPAVPAAVRPLTVSAPPPAESSSPRRTLGIAGIVAGGVLLVGSVAAWAYGWSVTSDYNNDPSCPSPSAPSIPAACQSRLDTARVMEPLGWTGMIAGAVIAAAGGVLLGTAPRSSREHAWELSPGPGAVGAGLRVRF